VQKTTSFSSAITQWNTPTQVGRELNLNISIKTL